MSQIKEFYFPKSLAEAGKILAEKPSARILAGGCTLVLLKNPDFDTLVDITRLGLSYIKAQGDFILIGAATLPAELAKSSLLTELAGGMIPAAAMEIGSSHIRNLATVGGNLAQPFWWNVLPPLFLALEAKLKIYGGGGGGGKEKIIELSDFYRKKLYSDLKSGIITEILLKKPSPQTKGKLVKFARTRGDLAALNLAVVLEKEKTLVKTARIAVGAAVAFPQRVKEAEEILTGKAGKPALWEKAGQTAQKSLKTLSDFRGSSKFRSNLIQVLLSRTLKELWEDQEA